MKWGMCPESRLITPTMLLPLLNEINANSIIPMFVRLIAANGLAIEQSALFGFVARSFCTIFRVPRRSKNDINSGIVGRWICY